MVTQLDQRIGAQHHGGSGVAQNIAQRKANAVILPGNGLGLFLFFGVHDHAFAARRLQKVLIFLPDRIVYLLGSHLIRVSGSRGAQKIAIVPDNKHRTHSQKCRGSPQKKLAVHMNLPHGGQQHQRDQRRIHHLGRGNHHAHHGQRHQLLPAKGASGRIGQVKAECRKGKAQAQQQAVTAEGSRLMQRHGQQRCTDKRHFAKGGFFCRPSRKQRKGRQIEKAAQQKRRRKAQMQAKRQKHTGGAAHIQNGIGVGLFFKQPHMVAQLVGGGVGEVIRKLLPCEHGGFLVLDDAVKIAGAAVGIKNGHILHHPFVTAHTVGPKAGNGKAFVDVILLIGGSIGGQRHGKGQPKHHHNAKNGGVQRKVPAAEKQIQPAEQGREQQGSQPVIHA